MEKIIKPNKEDKIMKSGIIIILGLMIIITIMPLVISISDESSTIININQGGVICSSDGQTWINYGTNPPGITPTIGPGGDCYYLGANPRETCCPENFYCHKDVIPTVNLCEFTEKNYCHELTIDECENYEQWVADNSGDGVCGSGCCGSVTDVWDDDPTSGEKWCWNVTDCGCEWNPTGGSEGTGACDSSIGTIKKCDDTTETPVDSCTYSVTDWTDKCDEDGYIYATWEADGTNCQEGGVRPIPCEKVVKLGFFNIYNVIAVIAILIIIYYFYLKKNNKNSKNKKKKSR